jgi:hypothetical protein|tara:strand:+ start:101 stop:451 length:351 start_codon:yes stop_codon:yes gene_type:complete
MKIENLDMEALKEFAKFYDDYEVLDFENPNVMDTTAFDKSYKAILNALPSLVKTTEGVDSATPSTFITYQVVVQKLVTEKRFTEVQVNLKRWQEIGKAVDLDPKFIRALSIFTGYK